jgi:hypothetical protein
MLAVWYVRETEREGESAMSSQQKKHETPCKMLRVFVGPIPFPLVLRVLRCFGVMGVSSLDLNHRFTKNHMRELGTPARIHALFPELEPFYLPGKAAVYLHSNANASASERGAPPPPTIDRCISILRQVLRSGDLEDAAADWPHGLAVVVREINRITNSGGAAGRSHKRAKKIQEYAVVKSPVEVTRRTLISMSHDAVTLSW